ncbi:MAG: hypothetical protein QOH56_1597, partial [Pseudonocardiales bacterium]|nr:hypothetical protein [Pseudonocardiales bacterium]
KGGRPTCPPSLQRASARSRGHLSPNPSPVMAVPQVAAPRPVAQAARAGLRCRIPGHSLRSAPAGGERFELSDGFPSAVFKRTEPGHRPNRMVRGTLDSDPDPGVSGPQECGASGPCASLIVSAISLLQIGVPSVRNPYGCEFEGSDRSNGFAGREGRSGRPTLRTPRAGVSRRQSAATGGTRCCRRVTIRPALTAIDLRSPARCLR